MPYKFLEKFSKNEHTDEEHRRFIEWLRTAPPEEMEAVLEEYRQFFQQLPPGDQADQTELIKKIEHRLDLIPVKRSVLPLIRRMASVAAVAFIICYAGWQFYKRPVTGQEVKVAKKIVKIVPGGNKAVLTLADGSQIALDDSKNGTLAKQENTAIHKAKGQVIYDASVPAGSPVPAEMKYNIITTPRGGQYEVVLPDGSKVWLNAASSLRFPVAFTGNSRSVELTGEAYFEVAKNKLKPFRVSINHSEIEVLGTHFDVMGYTDEASTNTTLLEGSVRVTNANISKLIVPGEQARVNGGITVSAVNTAEVMEWKNGNFNFSHENIQSIMRKIARWYDVDIEYQGKTTKEGFVGTIPRSEDLSEVLKPLELTGLVHFKIVERRLVVMP